MSDSAPQSLAHIVVGVADLEPVRALWVDQFGMEVVAAVEGPDRALAGIWGIEAEQIRGQLLLRTPGAAAGWLHFVCFDSPVAAVRAGSAPHDLCPKNIDVNCVDMPARYRELEAAGIRFRSDISEYSIGEITAREVQAPVHDDVNLVLIEVFDYPLALSPRHYGAVTSFVLTVPDIERESRFYAEVFGLELVLEHRVAGPAIEQVTGLPPGAALLLRLMGSPEQVYGRVELIEYEGMAGANLYPRARPPALGSLLGRLQTRDLETFVARARARGIEVAEHGAADLLFGRCRMAALLTPAGFRLEVFERET